MTSADQLVVLFTIFNVLRILAYFPQIRCILRDRTGAASVSCLSWGLFGGAHAVTALYSLMLLDDRWLALFVAANALCCAVILILTINARRRLRAGLDSRPFLEDAHCRPSAAL